MLFVLSATVLSGRVSHISPLPGTAKLPKGSLLSRWCLADDKASDTTRALALPSRQHQHPSSSISCLHNSPLPNVSVRSLRRGQAPGLIWALPYREYWSLLAKKVAHRKCQRAGGGTSKMAAFLWLRLLECLMKRRFLFVFFLLFLFFVFLWKNLISP